LWSEKLEVKISGGFFKEIIQGVLSEKSASESAFFGGNSRLFDMFFKKKT